MFCFRLRRFGFHYIVSLYSSDYDSDYDSVASENQPLGSLSNEDDDAGDDARLKKNLYFTSEIRDCLDLVRTPMALKTCLSHICNYSDQFQMEIRKTRRRRPRSVDDAKLGHFTLLFFAEDGKGIQRF